MNAKSLTFASVTLVVLVLLMQWASGFTQKSESPKPTTRTTQISNVECDMGVKSACK